MTPIFNRVTWFLSIILLVSLACTLPTMAQKPAETPPAPLAVVKTAITNTSSPVFTLEPTFPAATNTIEGTSTNAITETPTLPVGVFPTDTPTLTPVPVMAVVAKDTYCRIGPGPNYDLVVVYKTGTSLQVIARDLGGGFLYIMNPAEPDETCYLLANNITVNGITDTLPKITPVASPTLAPSFTAVFKKFDTCKGKVFPQFIIQNTGSVPFRSVYIKTTNLKSGETTEKAANAFDLMTGCVIAKNIAPLEARASGYLSSEPFEKDPRGKNIRAIIQACTEQNLKGFCVNVVVQIVP